MANETSNATLVSNGGRISKLLAPFMHTMLYDPTGLRALMDFRPSNMAGAATQNITRVTRGVAAAAASSEVSGGGSNTLLTTGNFDLTVARYYAKMAPTDLFKMTSAGQALDVDYLIGVLAETLDLTLTDLLTAMFPNLAGSVGTSGVDLSVSDIFDAFFYLNLQNNPGDLMAVLHNQQINDLISSVRGETGPLQFRLDAQGLLRPPGVGFRGQFLGISFYQSDSVQTADGGANRCGAMFSQGAFAYTLGNTAPMLDGQMINPNDILLATPEMWLERGRDPDNGLSTIYVNMYPGVAEQEDLRGVRVKTDA